MGLEAVVAKEIQELGYDTQVENGRIFFEGDETAIVKCNLWLRTADRIKIVMGRFDAKTFDDLFEQTKALPWKQLSTKKVISQCKDVALNQHYTVYLIAKPSLRRQ